MEAIAPDPTCITRREQIERVCSFLAQAGSPQLPLFRAAADGAIGLIMVDNPKAPWPAEMIRRVERPVVILVSDDVPNSGRVSTPPEGWACAKRLRYWAPRAVIAHGAAGDAVHYRAAVVAALTVGRVAFIETNHVLAPCWGKYLGCPSTLVVIPRNGLPHPVPGGETVH